MKDLLAQARDFAFFQAVRLLEQRGGGGPLGERTPAASETVRLRPSAELAFPPCDIESVESLAPVPSPDGQAVPGPRYRLTTTFLGLYGASTPLPAHYAEMIAQADPADHRVRDFLDLFHHRLLSLLHRAWARHHYIALFAEDGTDDLSRRLLSWLGIDEALAARLGRKPVELLRHASVLGSRARSACALEGLWSDLCGVPLAIEENIPRRVTVPADQQARLGRQAVRLGHDFVLGQSVLDRSGKFRVIVGPLGGTRFEQFLPGGAALAHLEAVMGATLSVPCAYEVQVRVAPEGREPLRLGGEVPRRLGWTTWLGPEHATAHESAISIQPMQG